MSAQARASALAVVELARAQPAVPAQAAQLARQALVVARVPVPVPAQAPAARVQAPLAQPEVQAPVLD